MSFTRRSLITGIVSLVAAPAIVHASSLMPVKPIKPTFDILTNAWRSHYGIVEWPAVQVFWDHEWDQIHELWSVPRDL